MKNLIAISGKIGSGKDTIFTVIQLLITNKIRVARGAEPVTWKTFINPKNLSVSNQRRWDESGFQNKKFAYKLKQIAGLMRGILAEDFELESVKDELVPEEWGWWRPVRVPHMKFTNQTDCEYYCNNHNHGSLMGDLGGPEFHRPTNRELFLQAIGTDAIRTHVHTNAWVNALFADYKANRPCNRDQSETCVESPNCSDWAFSQVAQPEGVECNRRYPKWIITDCRFPNEAEAIEERGGLLIRVERPARRVGGTDTEPSVIGAIAHPSETALDNYKFKHTINNSGTIEELIEQVSTVLTKEGILCQQK